MSVPPLCDKCNTRHHSYQGHVFPAAGSRVTPAVDVVKEPPAAERSATKVAVTKPVTNNAATKRATKTERVRAWREKNRDRYNAYMRELMRKRAAARREAGA